MGFGVINQPIQTVYTYIDKQVDRTYVTQCKSTERLDLADLANRFASQGLTETTVEQ